MSSLRVTWPVRPALAWPRATFRARVYAAHEWTTHERSHADTWRSFVCAGYCCPIAFAWLPGKRVANHPVGARENAVAKPIYIVNY